MLGLIAVVTTAYGAIVINELEPDPAGTDGGYEWVELYNDGAGAVDISGWGIEKSTSGSWTLEYTFPPGTTIASGGYVVVAEELVAGATHYLAPGDTLAMGNASSSGDAVRLVDGFGLRVDTVVYGPDNSDGFLDDSGFVATSVAPTPAGVLARLPNGADTDQSGNDFQIAGFATIGSSNDAAAPSCDPVGNAIGLVINELMPDPAGTDTDMEWFELHLPSGGTVDLSGWVFASGTTSYSTLGTIPGGTTISAGQYLVVGQSGLVADVDVVAPGFSLGNASNADAAQLRDCFGNVVDTVVYGSDNSVDGWLDDFGNFAALAPPPTSGQSLQRIPDGTDTQNSANDFQVAAPTAGLSNAGAPPASCDPVSAAGGLVINELVPDPAGTDTDMEWVELYLPSGGTVDLSGWVVTSGTTSFSTQGVLPAGTSISSGQFLVVAQSNLVADADVLAPGFSLGNASNADAVQLRDCFGNVKDTVVYGLDNAVDGWLDDTGNFAALAPKPGSGEALLRIPDGADSQNSSVDFQIGFPTPGGSNTAPPPDCGALGSGIVINELMSNPAGADDGAEWIEIFHAGTSTVDLSGWLVQSATSDSWGTRLTFDPGTVMNPGQFLLLGGPLVPGSTLGLSGSLGNGSGGDGVRIVDCNNFPADVVVYGGTNEDGVTDESGVAAQSIAPTPPEGISIQRVQDGYDTNQSGLDFAVSQLPTPGQPNQPLEPIVCEPDPGTVRINEILPDPDGTDDGLEWIEIYNSGSAPARLDGWSISAGTSDYDDYDITFPGGIVVQPGEFFVVGGELVPEATYVTSFSLGNASSTRDGVRLFDCQGNSVDTVVYGVANEMEPDVGIVDDNDQLVPPYGDPGSQQSLQRKLDGVDTDTADDWKVGRPTPGSTNDVDFGPGDTDVPGRGCGRGGAPDAQPPGGDAPGGDAPNGRGCSVVPVELSLGGFALAFIAARRR